MTSAFKATGKPNDQVWASKLTARDPRSPHYAPPNAVLTNMALRDNGNPLRSIGLWVNAVSTGWTLNGSTGQTQKSNVFYPHNLSQNPLTVTGQMASQYEYDKLVEFVIQHRLSAIGHGGEQGPLTFLLPQRIIRHPNGRPVLDGHGNPKLRYKRLHVEGYIERLAAGHTRFIYQPEFTFNMMVTRDWDTDEREELTGTLNSLLQKRYRDGLLGTLGVVPHDSTPVRLGVGPPNTNSYWLDQTKNPDWQA